MPDQILIVEDELIVARDIRRIVEKAGYRVIGVAQTVEKARVLIEETQPSLVLVDIFLKGDLTGIDLAMDLNSAGIPFIYISANSNQPVLEAVKRTNPYGFIVKPFREKDLLVTLDIARYRYENDRRLKMRATAGSEGTVGYRESSVRNRRVFGYPGMIGESPSMLKVFDLIEQVAPYDTSVLILGESGTGKEVVANCICQLSPRMNRPFIKINCAAIPSSLMEAELFGYEKGSFSGATESRTGKFEQAAGGTILLDEIGEMPLDMQAKLLRVLQEKEIQRVGSNQVIKTDLRILAATNQQLEKLVAEGKFRLDLYYRLLVFPIMLPPLRERKEDIPLLIQYFIDWYSQKMTKEIHRAEEESLQRLLQYQWPGNIRELQHLVERSILMADGNVLKIILPAVAAPPPVLQTTGTTGVSLVSEDNEREHLLSVLRQCHFKVTGKGGAAELLNISPAALQRKIKKFGIKKTWFSEE